MAGYTISVYHLDFHSDSMRNSQTWPEETDAWYLLRRHILTTLQNRLTPPSIGISPRHKFLIISHPSRGRWESLLFLGVKDTASLRDAADIAHDQNTGQESHAHWSGSELEKCIQSLQNQAQLSRATGHQITCLVLEVLLMAVHSWSFHRHIEGATYFKFWHSWSNPDTTLFNEQDPKPMHEHMSKKAFSLFISSSHSPWSY